MWTDNVVNLLLNIRHVVLDYLDTCEKDLLKKVLTTTVLVMSAICLLLLRKLGGINEEDKPLS